MSHSRALAALACLALLSVSGCGLTARSGPSASALLAPGPGEASYDVVEVNAATIPAFTMPERVASQPSRALSANPRFALAPGDVVNVTIFERSDGGLFAPAATGGAGFPAVRVDDGGALTLPYVGRVLVAGATLAQASARIAAALGNTVVDPRVHVQLVSSASHSVLVAGEVRTPGRISLLDGPLSAVDAVARAGGPSQTVQSLDVVIHGPGGPQRMSYLELLAQPSLQVGMGQQVVLEPNERRFMAMGAVLQPGLRPMTMSRMSLLDGLGVAGGLNDRQAAPSGVFLLRLVGQATARRPTVFHLDMSRGDSLLLAHRFALLPDDVLYVSNAPIWEVQKVIAPFLSLLSVGGSVSAIGG